MQLSPLHTIPSGFRGRSTCRGEGVKCFCLYSFPFFILRQGKQPPPYFLPQIIQQPQADSCLFYQPRCFVPLPLYAAARGWASGLWGPSSCDRPWLARPWESYSGWDCWEPLVSQTGKPCMFRAGGSAPLSCRQAAWKLSSRWILFWFP